MVSEFFVASLSVSMCCIFFSFLKFWFVHLFACFLRREGRCGLGWVLEEKGGNKNNTVQCWFYFIDLIKILIELVRWLSG